MAEFQRSSVSRRFQVGSRSARVLRGLAQFESRNVTFCDADRSWPIVWERARGVQVWDADGRRYVDLTAAFGVMATGHTNPAVVRAGRRQLGRLVHAMGDLHPHALKAELARALSRVTFERWTHSTKQGGSGPLRGKSVFGNSGFEAVEAALKTAMLATGRRGVLGFTGAYHGLGYGTLNTTHREMFWRPFRSQLARFAGFLPFPERVEDLDRLEAAARRAFRRTGVGAMLAEPVQGRGGIRVPPVGFLPLLRRLCDEFGALLILDEVYTGFGRTGRWFACEHSGVVPDVICLGKAMTGGFPLSACVGKAAVMDAAWPRSAGEALHTSTFLGHPVGCAMALAQMHEIRRLRLPQRAALLGRRLLRDVQRMAAGADPGHAVVRGLGLMVGMELRCANGGPAAARVMWIVKEMLRRGFLVLPEGAHGEVISLTPPLTIRWADLAGAVEALGDALRSGGWR